MTPVLAWNRYGKSRVRLVKVRRSKEPHDVIDLTVDVRLEGDFAPVYVDGDNRSCLATDTMKNTVYAMARQDPMASIESFGGRLAEHFAGSPAVSRARISLAEQRWERVVAAGRFHAHAFIQPGRERWTSVVTRDSRGVNVASGLRNLTLLKTTGSGFSGFPRDKYTTLPDTADRILGYGRLRCAPANPPCHD
jgi:urate oxidase